MSQRINPFLSIIIPTYNREKILCDTIDSVLEQIEKTQFQFKYEFIIIDQSKSHANNVFDYLEKCRSQGVIIINEDYPNLPNARNIGLLHSKGDIVLFLDDDVILKDGFFTELFLSYQDSNIDSVVGGVILANSTPNNIILDNQSSIKRLIRKILIRMLGGNKAFVISKMGFVLSEPTCERRGIVDAGRGCNMSFRRTIFDKVGNFDSHYIGNALREESDLFCRIKKAGLCVLYNPQMSLFHIMANEGGTRSGKNDKYWNTYFFNQSYFYYKNFGFSYLRLCFFLFFDIIACLRSKKNIFGIVKKQYKSAKKIVDEAI